MLAAPRFRLKVAAKAVLLIVGLGLMSALANWFCLERLDRLDKINDTLVQHVEPARLALAEAKIAVTAMGLATYKMAGTTDVDTVHQAAGDLAGQYAGAKSWLNGVIGYYPGRGEDVRRIIGKLDLVNTIAVAVHDVAATGQRDRAQSTLELKFEPALDDATFHMNRLINILGGEITTSVEQAVNEKTWTYHAMLVLLIGGTLGTVLVAMVLAHQNIARPLQRLASVMRRIAAGQFDVQIDGLKRTDEVGTMAHSVLVFRDNAIALSHAEEQRARAREQAENDKRRAIEQFAGNFEYKILGVTEALARAAIELDRSARSMSDVADESGRYARSASVAAEETNQVASTVSNAIDELSTAMTEIDSQLSSASGVVAEATRRAEVAMISADELDPAVSDIKKVAGMIHGIASQTNLLALNATIEAARAGESGRGFAVVAQEVKTLSTRTTQALANIQERTGSVGGLIERVREATQSMSVAITQVEAVAKAITGSVRMQSQATQKIAESVDGAAARTRQVADTVAGVNDFAGRTRLNAQQILQAVEDLNRQATSLQQEAHEFVARVRAA